MYPLFHPSFRSLVPYIIPFIRSFPLTCTSASGLTYLRVFTPSVIPSFVRPSLCVISPSPVLLLHVLLFIQLAALSSTTSYHLTTHLYECMKTNRQSYLHHHDWRTLRRKMFLLSAAMSPRLPINLHIITLAVPTRYVF